MMDGLYTRNNDKGSRYVSIFLILIFLLFTLKVIIDSGHLLFFIVSLVILVLLSYLFEFIQKKKISRPAFLGKTYSKKYPIIIQYAPPKGINPAEAGLLYNCSVETTDLTSLIYQWKFERLIDIKTFKSKDSKIEYIKLIKIEEIPFSRPLFETEIFDSIFRTSSIKIIEGSFQLRYALMLEDLEYHGIQKGWLKENKSNISKNSLDTKKLGNKIPLELVFLGVYFVIYYLITIFSSVFDRLGVSLDFSFDFFINFTDMLWSLIVLVVIVVGVALFYGEMDGGGRLKYTEKGAELASQVIGYSKFIKICDENMIKLFLKEDPLFIDRTLPYATAFGMETEFLKKVSPLKKDWNAKYVGGKKVPKWVSILHFFFRNDGNF